MTESRLGPYAEDLDLQNQKHIQKTTAELKQEARAAAAAPQADAKLKARQEREYAFHFVWKDGRGASWEGDFVSVIPTIAQRQFVGTLRARMGGGMPYAALDPVTNQINMVVSLLEVMLKEDTRPKWAADLRTVFDPDLLFALYEEVQAHEATFLGRGDA